MLPANSRSTGIHALYVFSLACLSLFASTEIALSQDETCDPGLSVECESFDDHYPIVISWTVEDVDMDYSEFWITRNGDVIVTITDSTEREYTDLGGTSGQLSYTVSAFNEDGDCVATSEFPCYSAVGFVETCATFFDFEPLEFGSGSTITDTILDTYECGFDAIDGSTDDDSSPTEDDRFDIADLTVSLRLTASEVGALTLNLSSPEGTTLLLWDEDGGDVEWTDERLELSDIGETIPIEVPETCDRCTFRPAGIDGLEAFYGEDSAGDWTLELESDVEATLKDWCIKLFPDEYGSGGGGWLRGDVDGNGVVSAIIDCLRLLQYQFGDGDELPCEAAADVNGDGKVRALVDSIYLLAHFFGDVPEPPAPYPFCGIADPDYGPVWRGCPESEAPEGVLTCLTLPICP